jgi:hypothetical protein
MQERRHLTADERSFLQALVLSGGAGDAFMLLGNVWANETGDLNVRDAGMAAYRAVRDSERQHAPPRRVNTRSRR